MLLIISVSTTFLENSEMPDVPPIEIFCLRKIISLSITFLPVRWNSFAPVLLAMCSIFDLLIPDPGIIVILLPACRISWFNKSILSSALFFWPDVRSLSAPVAITSSSPLEGSLHISNALWKVADMGRANSMSLAVRSTSILPRKLYPTLELFLLQGDHYTTLPDQLRHSEPLRQIQRCQHIFPD